MLSNSELIVGLTFNRKYSVAESKSDVVLVQLSS